MPADPTRPYLRDGHLGRLVQEGLNHATTG